jgi:tetratricopeptide (TPR) repeat protein
VWPFVAIALVAVIGAGLFAFRDRLSSPYSTEIRLAVMPFERIGDSPPLSLVDGITIATDEAFNRAARVHKSMWVLPRTRIEKANPPKSDSYADLFGVNRVILGRVTLYGNQDRLILELRDADVDRVIRSVHIDFDPRQMNGLPALLAGAAAGLLGIDSTKVASEPGLFVGSARVRAALDMTAFIANDSFDELRDETIAWENNSAEHSSSDAVILGMAYAELYQHDNNEADASSAERWLNSALDNPDSRYEANKALARLDGRLGRIDTAQERYSACLEESPTDIIVYERSARLFLEPKRYHEALKVYEALVTRYPDYYYGQWCYGWASSQMADDEAFLRQAERALELAPHDSRSLNSLGVLYSERGNWRQARIFWERAFLVQPKCTTCGNVGYALYFEGRYREATRYFEYALEFCDSKDAWRKMNTRSLNVLCTYMEKMDHVHLNQLLIKLESF